MMLEAGCRQVNEMMRKHRQLENKSNDVEEVNMREFRIGAYVGLR